MSRRVIVTLAALALLTTFAAPAQDETTPPAVLELVLPAGATATADGKPIDDPRAFTVGDLKPIEIRRVKVAVKFADGTADERLVDVTPGLRVRLAVPPPGPEKAMVVGMQPLVPINSAAVRRDGRYIAVGLDDRTVVLWDTADGRPVRTLAGHQKAVLSVAFIPDGKRLVSGSADGTAITVGRRGRRAAADLQGPHRGPLCRSRSARTRAGSLPDRPTGRRSSGTPEPAR